MQAIFGRVLDWLLLRFKISNAVAVFTWLLDGLWRDLVMGFRPFAIELF